MTTIYTLCKSGFDRGSVRSKLQWAVLLCLTLAAQALGQREVVHWNHAGAMPPGAIGRQRLARGGPLSGFCQPVAIRAAHAVRIAPAVGSGFGESQANELMVGLQIGPVYRFRITHIPEHPGVEVFPTIELVDRLYPPPGQSLRFPIPIELTREELVMAAEGRFITRVIYLENPLLAPAIARKDQTQPWVEARPGDDPLVVADRIGRPMAILRMGGRVPTAEIPDNGFLYGAPPVMIYDQARLRKNKK